MMHKFALVFFLTVAPAFGADFHTARTVGLGGAGHAGPLLNDSIYLNPSYLAFLKNYSIQGNYLWFKGEPHGRNMNVSIQDGTSEFFAAGLAYTIREDLKVLNAGLGRAVHQRFSVGVGAKMVMPRGDASNTLDASVST